jgi:hypothetical protein
VSPQPGRNLNDLPAFLVSGTAGDYIYRRGESGSDLYVLRHGEIALMRGAGEGAQAVRLTAGHFFGEASLFANHARDADALALTDYQLVRLDRASFDAIVREDPQIAVDMLRLLAGRRSPEAVATEEPVLVAVASGRRFPIRSGAPQIIGRTGLLSASSVDLDLGSLDPGRTLSRRHAQIVRRTGQVYLEPFPTLNGTYVNDAPVATGVDVTLHHGFRIRLGEVELRLVLEAPAPND